MLIHGPIDCRRAAESVRGPGRGAVVLFEGRVRSREAGSPISSITYEAYGAMARRQLAVICRTAKRRWGVAVFLCHRVGRVPAGEPAVVVACAAKHRREAFAACRFIIDSVKKRVPIWKAGFARRKAR